MTIRLSLNTGPSLNRVILIAVLLMLEAICINLAVIFSQNRMPEPYEIGAILTTVGAQLVTYIVTFLKKEGS